MSHDLAGRPLDQAEDITSRPFDVSLKRAQDLIGANLGVLRDGDSDLTQAMQYALSGGKALRAFLVLESARMNGIDRRQSMAPALAIECIHAYSLIHDDLPCMDDDDLRRGQPTVHRKWNEHTAVLAGDALQALAFNLLCHPGGIDPKVRVELVRTLAIAAGHRG